jgi:hypothetical protein
LDGALVKMVAATLAGGAVCVRTGRREQVLPAQVASSGWDFPGEAARKIDKTAAGADILDVTHTHSIGLAQEVTLECIREDGDPVVATFAASDHDLTAIKGKVFDADRERFHETKSRAIEQIRYEPRETLHFAEHRKDLATRQHGLGGGGAESDAPHRMEARPPSPAPGGKERGWRSQLVVV